MRIAAVVSIALVAILAMLLAPGCSSPPADSRPGAVGEGPYVAGKAHGHWVFRLGAGFVEEGPYVHGVRHGRWVHLFGAVAGFEEGPYVHGDRHGRWVARLLDGTLASETTWVDGVPEY